MPTQVFARSATGEFGITYASNGRVSNVYCTDPRGVSAKAVLTDGRVVEGALSGGQTLALPANAATFVPGPPQDMTGVARFEFHWGA